MLFRIISKHELLRGLFSAVLLFLTALTRFHPFALIIFFGAAFFWYFKTAQDRKKTFWSFTLLAVGSAAALFFVSETPQSFAAILRILLILIFGFAMYILFAIESFLLRNPEFAYDIVNTFLIFLTGAILSFMNGFSAMWITSGLLFLTVFLLFREWAVFYGVFMGKRLFAVGFTVALLGMELFAVLTFFSFNSASNGAIIAIFLLAIRNIILSYHAGRLDTRLVFQQTSVFAIVLLIIFALA